MILGLIGYFGYKFGLLLYVLIVKFINNYESLAIALITGLFAFISVPVGKYLENRNTIKNKVREEKTEIYTSFIEWLIDNTFINTYYNKENPNIVDDVIKYKKKIIVYASDKVLTEFIKLTNQLVIFEQYKEKNKVSNEIATKEYIKTVAPLFENLIISIRKELGYNSKNIKQYDILRLYVNDVDKYI